MRYRLEVRNEAGDIETVIEESTINRLESHFGRLEAEEMSMDLKQYLTHKLTERFKDDKVCICGQCK